MKNFVSSQFIRSYNPNNIMSNKLMVIYFLQRNPVNMGEVETYYQRYKMLGGKSTLEYIKRFARAK